MSGSADKVCAVCARQTAMAGHDVEGAEMDELTGKVAIVTGAGRIVNIGGLSAHTGAKDRAHVVTAKAGIVGFTRALAHDLASDGITVNCVVPGLIGTPRPKDKPEPAHHLVHQTITGERGKPEDVAAAVRFLCGEGARYITGQAIHANGGAYLGA